MHGTTMKKNTVTSGYTGPLYKCVLISDFSWSDSKFVSSAKIQLSHSLTMDHAMKAHDALEVHLHIFLTSSLDEGERSVPRPQLLYPRGHSAVSSGQETGWAPQPVHAFRRKAFYRRESNR